MDVDCTKCDVIHNLGNGPINSLNCVHLMETETEKKLSG